MKIFCLIIAFLIVGCSHNSPTAQSTGAPTPNIDVNSLIDKHALRAAIKEKAPDIKACYVSALNRVPELRGKLVVNWTIAHDGSVKDTKIKPTGDLNDEKFRKCVIDKISNWKFENLVKSNSEAVVNFPFTFSQP